MDITPRLKEILTTITEEAQIASIKKAEELNFDLNRAEITLSEAYYNLNEIRDQLVDAIEKGKFSQLPLTIQRKFLADLENVAGKITGLIGGIDEVVNLVNIIEVIYVDLWNSRISTISEEHLGYVTKMNQLKHLLIDAKNLQKELQEGLGQKNKLQELIVGIETKNNEIGTLLSGAVVNTQSIQEALGKTTETNQQVTSIAADVSANEKVVKDLLAEVRSSDTTIKTIEKDGQKFSEDIANYKDTIQIVGDNAKKVIEDNTGETKKLISTLEKLEGQIKDQIQKATGYSLFQSFQTRQEKISKNKDKWLVYIGILVGITLGLTAIIAYNHSTYDVAFYLKLSMSLPLIFGISFCTVQYSRERKLEEEYAFKSNISISLVPYKELIEKLSITPEQKERFTAFLIDSISRVFTSPTESVFGGEGHPLDPEHALKQLSKTMESLMKPIEPVLKAINAKK